MRYEILVGYEPDPLGGADPVYESVSPGEYLVCAFQHAFPGALNDQMRHWLEAAGDHIADGEYIPEEMRKGDVDTYVPPVDKDQGDDIDIDVPF